MIARTAKRHADRREATAQASQKIQLTHPPSFDGFDLLPLGGVEAWQIPEQVGRSESI